MEVHPPEHGIHSWRDFLVHMGTIVLGLLIALSLEQSVEALHRLHERHELEEHLLQESKDNEKSLEMNFQFADLYLNWLHTSMQDLRASKAAHTPLVFIAPPSHFPGKPDDPLYMQVFDSGSWTAAKQNGTAALLPPEEENSYEDLYWECSNSLAYWQRLDDGMSTVRAFWYRFTDPALSPIPDLSHLDDKDADEYAALLAKQFELTRNYRRELLFFAAVNRASLSGPSFEGIYDGLLPKVIAEHPDKYPGLDDISLGTRLKHPQAVSDETSVPAK